MTPTGSAADTPDDPAVAGNLAKRCVLKGELRAVRHFAPYNPRGYVPWLE